MKLIVPRGQERAVHFADSTLNFSNQLHYVPQFISNLFPNISQ